MLKRMCRLFLVGTTVLLVSCIDDMYDLANKELVTDVKFEGNRIALPIGSLRPIILDSLLDLSTIPMLEADSATKAYSLSLSDSMVTSVAKKDLSVLEEVSKLSAEISPVVIDLPEVKFSLPSVNRSEELSFADITIDDVSLDPIHEEVLLPIEQITIDPIPVKEDTRVTTFDIPKVEVDNVPVDRFEQVASFAIGEVSVESVKSPEISNSIAVEVPNIPMDKITTPSFATTATNTLNIAALDALLQGQGENFKLPSSKSFDVNLEQGTEGKLDIQFHYEMPKEIKSLNRVVMAHSDNTKKGALIDFVIVNPTLIAGQAKRTVDFQIGFPSSYVLEKYDDNYTLSDNNTTISVKGMDATGDETHIRFYIKEIKGLDADKYYDNGELKLDEHISYSVTYKANGTLAVEKGTTYKQIKEGLSYSMGLESTFDVEEVYGDISPVESTLKTMDLDFSFDINDLDYIKAIDKVVLNPAKSVLKFSTSISKDLGDFDLDANSKIVLSLPTQYVFADNVNLPTGVTRVQGTNDFEISSIKAFSAGVWEFPVKEVRNTTPIENGTLKFGAKAYIKAISGGKEGVLTIKEMKNLALKEATMLLCDSRQIAFQAAPATLAVTDVVGSTNPIGIGLEEKTFAMDFEIKDLDYIKSVGFVQFKAGQKISIASSSNVDFGAIKFDEGNYIALKFPEAFEFDYDNCSLAYDKAEEAFIINDLSALKNGKWTLALKRININQEVKDKTLAFNSAITMKAVNNKGVQDTLYFAGIDNFSIQDMKGLFGENNITFAVEETSISVEELQGASENINIEFAGETVNYDIDIKDLEYVERIGDIKLKPGSNFLKFRSSLEKSLGDFDLAEGSSVELKFPEVFVLDRANSSVPTGVEIVDNMIRVKSLKALSSGAEWKLAVERIAINEPIIDKAIKKSYTIDVVARDVNGEEGNLTIAGLDPFRLSDIVKAGGANSLEFSILPSDIEIEDIQASIGEMAFDFETQYFRFPVSIPKLDMVDEVKYISFKDDANKIKLTMKMDGTSIAPFELAEKSVVKITFPKEFIFDSNTSSFGKLDYDYENNALYIKNISDIEDCELVLALDRIQMDKKIENDSLKWNGEISVTALNTEKNEEGKLYIAGIEDLKLSDIMDAMGDKTISFDIPEVKFGIEEAVIVSNTIETEIKQDVALSIDEVLPAAIDRIDYVGFAERVPMTLKLKTSGLDKLDAPIELNLRIGLPSVFSISSEDERISYDGDTLAIRAQHNFKESNTIELKLWVNNLDFTTLKPNGEGYLALLPVEGKKDERRLLYETNVGIVGYAAIGNAELSSDLLNEDISMDIAFEMGDVVLKDFTGIYGGGIDPVVESFELGIEDGFAELEKNGLTLSNTKPELMITLYNSIGVPVNVDLSIIGRDKNGQAIGSSTIETNGLYIKPAKEIQGVLTADTTRWLFTSNEAAQLEGYETVHIPNLDSLLNNLPYSIDFSLKPQIVTKNNGETVLHHVDLSQPLELGGSYSISVPFDLQFAQSIPLEFGEEADAILRNEKNNLTLGNPQLALSIHNPIAQELAFDLSLIGKNANDEPISTATIFDNMPFVLAAGQRNADGTITPKATRWLFAVNDSITRPDFETKATPALGTLLKELPHKIDIELNTHFNTDITAQIDYNNDLELTCEYGILMPLQFEDLHFNYADTISEIKLNLEETLEGMGLSVTQVELALSMNLKSTLPLGLTINLTPLDAKGNVVEGVEIGNIELPAGDGSAIGTGESVKGTPVELSIKCASPSALAELDKVAFKLDVASGNGNNALSGSQGLQISDIVLQIMCDVEVNLTK